MSPDRHPGDLEDDGHGPYEDEAPRSIFSALWFRALLAVLVLGVLGAVAVPYVLDVATTPAVKGSAAKAPEPAPAPPPAVTAAVPTAAPTAPPAPAPKAETAEPARPKPETQPAPAAKAATARPAAEKPAPAKAAPVKAASAKTPATKPAASKPAVVAKAAEAPKAATKAAEPATKATEPATKAASAGSGGPFWVQVGAFKDTETAKGVATRLRAAGLHVEESTTAAKGGPAAPTAPSAPVSDRYDVVVSGASAADVEAKLTPKGLTGEATAGGVVVRPSLALRDAVALSRDLADAGLSVQVRRVAGPAPSPAPAASAPAQTLHRVRVGGFADRAAAMAALKQLEGKGFKPFIAREGQ